MSAIYSACLYIQSVCIYPRAPVGKTLNYWCCLSSPALLEKPASLGSPATSPVMDTHLVPSSPLFPPSCPGTPPAQDDGWRQTGPRGAASNIKTSPTGVRP